MDDSPEALAAKRGQPLPSDCWLDVVRMYPPAEWLKASGMVLVDVFEDQDPPIKRIPANELLIMQGGNARVLEDNALLFHEDVVAVCSPDWLARNPVAAPADLLSHMLLSLEARPDAWERWFAAAGMTDAAIGDGPVYEHLLMLAHAAAAGMGMALIPSFLIRPELPSGALVTSVDVTLSASEAYYLGWPRSSSRSPLFDRFRHWLLDEARAEV